MIPLRRALYLSRNTVSVRLLQSVGVERARQLLMDFGLQEDQIPRNFTIALGTPQVLPVQMATGYATIAMVVTVCSHTLSVVLKMHTAK